MKIDDNFTRVYNKCFSEFKERGDIDTVTRIIEETIVEFEVLRDLEDDNPMALNYYDVFIGKLREMLNL